MALGSEPRKGQSDPAVVEARTQILETCRKRGIPAGIHTNSVDVAVDMIRQGFQLTSLQSDDRFLMQKAKEEVTAVRTALDKEGL
jgi:2-keto-3-deoxy-L-rhamnonate aldolase RhmA